VSVTVVAIIGLSSFFLLSLAFAPTTDGVARLATAETRVTPCRLGAPTGTPESHACMDRSRSNRASTSRLASNPSVGRAAGTDTRSGQ
jgi:hypothetical protein